MNSVYTLRVVYIHNTQRVYTPHSLCIYIITILYTLLTVAYTLHAGVYTRYAFCIYTMCDVYIQNAHRVYITGQMCIHSVQQHVNTLLVLCTRGRAAGTAAGTAAGRRHSGRSQRRRRRGRVGGMACPLCTSLTSPHVLVHIYAKLRHIHKQLVYTQDKHVCIHNTGLHVYTILCGHVPF